jgi:hypothetical protein
MAVRKASNLRAANPRGPEGFCWVIGHDSALRQGDVSPPNCHNPLDDYETPLRQSPLTPSISVPALEIYWVTYPEMSARRCALPNT